MPKNACNSFFVVGEGISAKAFSFLGSGFMLCLEMILLKNETDEHLKRHLPLCNFRFRSTLLSRLI